METTKEKGFQYDAEKSGKAAVPVKTWKNIVSPGMIKKVLLTAVGLFAFYLLSLTLVYCIPKSAMVENVAESIGVIAQDGKYPNWFFGSPVCFFDNYSDSRMLNMALQTSEHPFHAAMSADYEVAEGSADTPFPQYLDLVAAAEGKAAKSESYGRMWHGYLVWLKPMLTFLNLHEIRQIIYMVSFFLYLLTILAMNKKMGFRAAFPFICATLMSYTTIITINMMFSVDVNLMLLGVMMVLLFSGSQTYDRYEPLFFGLIGTSMAFWGTFEAPLITLGMPLLVSLQMRQRRGKNAKQLWGHLIGNCAGYGIVYSVTLVSKWILAALVTGSSDGTSVSGGWIGLPPSFREYIRRLDSILQGFLTPLRSMGILILLTAVVMVVLVIRFRAKKVAVSSLLPYLFIFCFPAFWALVLFGHSGHGFTRFIMMISVDAFLWIAMNFIDWDSFRSKLRKGRFGKTGLLG